MSVSTSFDLLLRGGRVIDPASGVDGLKDVAVRDGKIAVVQSDVLPSSAREVVDVTGKIVLPGLIDTHAHVCQYRVFGRELWAATGYGDRKPALATGEPFPQRPNQAASQCDAPGVQGHRL